MVLRPPYQLIFFSPQITLAFLMSVLLKKPFLTGLAVFLLTIFWGSLGFTALYKHLPAFMEWSLCFLSPFAFTTGMAQVRSKIIVFCFFMLLKFIFIYLDVGVSVHMHRHAVTLEDNLAGVSSLLPPWGLQGSNSGTFTSWAVLAVPRLYLCTQHSKHIPSMTYIICTKH